MNITTLPATFPDTSLETHQFTEKVKASIHAILGDITGRKSSNIFPGPNPVSIDRGDFTKLSQQPYAIAEKTDGVRALMLICDIEDQHIGALFDRRVDTPYVATIKHMPRSLYQGTVLDGEIVFDHVDNTFVYLIFDAYQVSGVPVFHLPFSERLLAVKRSLLAYTPTPAHDTILLRIKTFLPLVPGICRSYADHLGQVHARYKIDGVIFMPELDPVVYGRHDNLLKLKQVHSVDFLCRKGKLLIYDETTKRHRVIGTPTECTKHRAMRDGDIVECVLPSLDTPEAWDVIKVRTDKNKANNKFTLDKTLLNIREGLSLDSVCKELGL